MMKNKGTEMTANDKARARALTKIFSAQELEYITEWITATDHQTDPHRSRVEDIVWEAHGMAVQSMDSI